MKNELTTIEQKELILLCDTVVTELACSRTGYCKPDNRQIAVGKKLLNPIDVFIHITTEYHITTYDLYHIIGYFNSKFKGRYGNKISNKQIIEREANS